MTSKRTKQPKSNSQYLPYTTVNNTKIFFAPYIFTIGGLGTFKNQGHETTQNQQEIKTKKKSSLAPINECQLTRAFRTENESFRPNYPIFSSPLNPPSSEPFIPHLKIGNDIKDDGIGPLIGAFARYYQKSIYIFGGKTTPTRVIKAKYDNGQFGEFQQLSGASLLHPRYKSACVQSNTESRYIYFVGGKDKNNVATDECERFDIDTGQSHSIAKLNIARHSAGITIDNAAQVIIVAGGVGVDGKDLDSIEIYDNIANSWVLLSEDEAKLSVPKRGIHIVKYASADRMFIYGGRSKSQGTESTITYYHQFEIIFLSEQTGKSAWIKDYEPIDFHQCVIDYRNEIAYFLGGTNIKTGELNDQIYKVYANNPMKQHYCHLSTPRLKSSSCILYL